MHKYLATGGKRLLIPHRSSYASVRIRVSETNPSRLLEDRPGVVRVEFLRGID